MFPVCAVLATESDLPTSLSPGSSGQQRRKGTLWGAGGTRAHRRNRHVLMLRVGARQDSDGREEMPPLSSISPGPATRSRPPLSSPPLVGEEKMFMRMFSA